MSNKKNISHSRSVLAITLIVASFFSAVALTFFSQKGGDYWVAVVDITPGHRITQGDVKLSHFDLNSSQSLYLGSSDDPHGLITITKIVPGQILSSQGLTSNLNLLATSAVPISIRAFDLAAGIEVGDGVDIYLVIDSQNGEVPVEPVLIMGGVPLLSYDQKTKNFGTDASLTVSIEKTQVLRVLAATTRGRLVVVRAHG